MKKRLLITSIVMMLVVALALSTATYAWFTQNASVTAQTVTMTAGVADGQSISIGWLGSEIKGTTLTGVAGDPLQPMAPTTNFSEATAASAAFTGAFVKVDGKFAADGEAKTPYTWHNASTTAFYINNDSNNQAVTIKVNVAEIANSATLTALADNTLLEGGKVYYRSTNGSSFTKLESGTDYTPNVSKVTDTAATSGTNINTGLATGTIYSTKGVQDYVRIAVFATTAQASPLSTVSEANYTYKGLLAKNAGTNTVYGSISANATAADMQKMASVTGNVTVIENLPKLNRVYVIVKVWLDGADFTEHESNQAANVSLTFDATNYVAPAQG